MTCVRYALATQRLQSYCKNPSDNNYLTRQKQNKFTFKFAQLPGIK